MFTVLLFLIESKYDNSGGMAYIASMIADVVGTLGFYSCLEMIIKKLWGE